MKTRWILLLVLVVALGAFFAWRHSAARPSGAGGAANGNGHDDAARAVPVVLAEVTRRDVPVWLSGLGTVQAFNTVTVRPRVSGTLDTVNFTEGQSVKEGDVLARIDPRPYRATLEQVLAKKAQNEALLANARLDLTRVRALVESDAESRRLLEQQEATVSQLIAILQADQAAIDAARLDLDFTTLRAPIAGRTGVRLLDAGNIVTANQGAGLVVITQLQPVSVLFTLPQQYLDEFSAHLRPDSPELLTQAVTDDGRVLAEGRLALVDNQIDTTTGNLRLKATFANEDLSLWPGQFVSARVLVATRKDAIVVPTEVIQPGLDGPFAYVVKADHTVEARPVKPGYTVDGFTIIGGLEPGDRVVRDGQSKLKPGASVAPVTEEKKP
ncbi:RND transporter [Opitutaceae bacterium TAV5]|nr:RND transporter [Opitutaceae bacterium TAV5]